MNPDSLQRLSDLAVKDGPFFFSVLFIIFLTRWSYKKYFDAIRANPPMDEADCVLHRRMYISNFSFGVLLVGIALVWWWKFQPTKYYFRCEISNLQPQEEIAADTYYLKREQLTAVDDDLLRNEHFLVEQDHPFIKGQVFSLRYSKDRKHHSELRIPYKEGGDELVYVVDYDPQSDRPVLHLKDSGSLKTTTSSQTWGISTPVYAAEHAIVELQQRELSDTAVNLKAATGVLRDPYSSVSLKINTIDFLNEAPIDKVRPLLESGAGEPFALTVFDLTQHSDRELAVKAKALALRLDVDSYLLTSLSSSQRSTRDEAEHVLLRISNTHALSLLSKAPIERYDDLQQAKLAISSGKMTDVLKPTASPQGDRYYVKATWSTDKAQTVACLTDLFNKQLMTSRTPQQEQSAMQGKTQRYVYWYGKEWSLWISSKIRACGANADFVHPY